MTTSESVTATDVVAAAASALAAAADAFQGDLKLKTGADGINTISEAVDASTLSQQEKHEIHETLAKVEGALITAKAAAVDAQAVAERWVDSQTTAEPTAPAQPTAPPVTTPPVITPPVVTPPVVTPPVTSTTVTPSVAPPWDYEVAFDEEWNEGKLNPKVWAADFQGDTQNVSSSNDNISVGSNGLELALSSPSVGAAITSRPNGAAKPGFAVALPLEVESQATLQGTNGKVDNWPGLWLVATLGGTSWEVDYCEGINGQVTATLHVWTNNNQTDVASRGLPLGQDAGEHVFTAILADANEVTFAVDGKTIGTQSWPTPVAAGAEFYNLASIGTGDASWNDPEVIPGLLIERSRRIFVPKVIAA